MKKVVLALAVIATVACFSSCTKTCVCTNGVTSTETTIKSGKCSDLNTSTSVAGVTVKTECTQK